MRKVVNIKLTLTEILREQTKLYLSAKEIAKKLGLKVSWIKNKLNQNTFKSSKIEFFEYGNTRYYSLEDFKKWYNNNYKRGDK